jgi:hypothetical protein
MVYVIADRVKETTTTTGTGTLSLAGAVSGYQSFINAILTNNQCNYTLLSGNGTDWEDGVGTVVAGSPPTLTRTIIVASSNVVSGVPQAISLTGTSTVLIGFTAAQAMIVAAAPIVPPKAASNWTAFNSATLSNAVNGLAVSATGGTTNSVRGAFMAAPSTPYTIDANIAFAGGVVSGNYASVFIGWSNGAALDTMQWYHQANSGFLAVSNEQAWTNATTPGAAGPIAYMPGINMAGNWVRIADSGTNITMSMSQDGVNWTSVYTVAKASGVLGASGYSQVGFGVNSVSGAGTTPVATLRSWWQH